MRDLGSELMLLAEIKPNIIGKHVCPPMFDAEMDMQVMMSDQGLCQNKKHENLLNVVENWYSPLKYH